MKKTQEILGLPIISISDGMEVGKVKSIIINAEKGAIDYIVVDGGIQILSARVIPTDNILGIGEYAVTIENDSAINDISKIPAAIDLLQKNIQVKGTKVLTKKGRLIGEIGDVFVDEDDNCGIIGLEYIADITQKRVRIIPRKNVITFGKNLVVVSEDVESALLDKPTELLMESGAPENEKKNLNFESSLNISNEVPAYSNSESEEDNTVEEYQDNDLKELLNGEEEAAPVLEELSADKHDSVIGSDAASLFEQRQRQYLIGRTATKTIMDNDGSVIVAEGARIDEDIVELAKLTGKLVELVMNNKA